MTALASTIRPESSDRPVALWLLVLCAMVLIMVVLGGATRLTGSGLSIVEWRPVTGILPPMSAAEWQAAFDAYRATPEFRAVNFWMTVADFKSIYWLEYLHRLWGRAIGVAFVLPCVYFLIQGRIGATHRPAFAILFALGAAQGALGWAMVASGLIDRPSVSHYRLAAHLALAAAIYGWMLWMAMALLRGPRSPRGPRSSAMPARLGMIAIGLIAITLVWGALVAGLRAGAIYNTFPLMGDELIPFEFLALVPWPINLVENPASVQFIHRALATTVLLVVLALWVLAARAPHGARASVASRHFAIAALVQYGLGIAALLSQVALPLGLLHQAGAFVLLGFGLWFVREVRA